MRGLIIAAALALSAPAFAQTPQEVAAHMVEIAADGALRFQGTNVTPEELVAALRAQAAGGYDGRIYLRAPAGASYPDVLRVLNLIQDAGFNQITLTPADAPADAPAGEP